MANIMRLGGGGGSKLPEGYTKVEYIESTGTQWIDTGYKFTSEKVQVVLDLVNTNLESSVALCGSENSSASGTSGVATLIVYSSGGSGQGEFTIEHGNGATGMSLTIPVNSRSLLDITADNGTITAFVNDTSYTGTYAGYTEKLDSFALFADNKDGSALLLSKYRLYSCKIYDNGTLVRDFVPCYDSDGVAGLYDLKNKVFYTNAGSGEFEIATADSEPTLLWTNASPTSSFAEQTISVNGDGFDSYLAECDTLSGQGTRGITYLNKSATSEQAIYSPFGGLSNVAFRPVTVNGNNLSFGKGGYGGGITRNEYAIPTRIWGANFRL